MYPSKFAIDGWCAFKHALPSIGDLCDVTRVDMGDPIGGVEGARKRRNFVLKSVEASEEIPKYH